ncbi:MAG: avidin/streptavidin family protein [Rhizobiaceae bacterium]
MKIFVKFLLCVFLYIYSAAAWADQQGVAAGTRLLAGASTWTNQSGSTATISFTQSATQPGVYTVSGNYINNASGFNCQGTPYPLTGIYYANTQTISFSVAWSNSAADCASVTGWTGYIDISSSTLQMPTNWNLAYASPGGGKIMTGQDVFTLSTPKMMGTLLQQ